MTSERRMAAPDAKKREDMMDAAEQIMLDEGYAAVTSRNVARRAGLKYQIIYYYFHTMDELFLAVFCRRAEQGLKRHAEALSSAHPLRALWEFNTEPESSVLIMEFVALANRRKDIRTALAHYATRFRDAEITALREIMRRYGFGVRPAVVAVLLAGMSRLIVLEQTLGVTGGHADTLTFIERQLRRIEDDPSTEHHEPESVPETPPPTAAPTDDVDPAILYELLSAGGTW